MTCMALYAFQLRNKRVAIACYVANIEGFFRADKYMVMARKGGCRFAAGIGDPEKARRKFDTLSLVKECGNDSSSRVTSGQGEEEFGLG